MGQYDSFVALANRLIGKWDERSGTGALSIIQTTVADPADPAKPWRVGAATDDSGTAVEGVKVEDVRQYVAAGLAEQGQTVFLIAPNATVTPAVGHTIKDGTRYYSVRNYEPLSPGGVLVLHQVAAELL